MADEKTIREYLAATAPTDAEIAAETAAEKAGWRRLARREAATAKRPDMRDYFRGRIDWHVHGMMAGYMAPLPRGVRRCEGDVTAETITVTMEDGSVFRWEGGRYAARKAHGTYAPLMPKPVA